MNIDLIQLENSVEEFLSILQSLETDKLIITSLSYIALFNNLEIKALIEKPVKNITKISIDGTPVDLFIVNKKYFLGLLSKRISQSRWKEAFSSYLFNEILHSNFERIKDIQGHFIFSNNLAKLKSDHEFTTIDNYVFPVGKTKSVIAVPEVKIQ